MKLKELTLKIGSGATPRGGKNAYLGGEVSLIRSQNVLDNGFSYEGLARISDKQASNLDSVSIFEGDVLLNITGDSIARCCMAPSEILPARVNQHVAIIRPKQEVSTEYLMYWLLFMKSHLLNICRVGGTRNALTKETIEELDIDYPEDAVKRVAVLKVLDDKISNNKKLITELEGTARLIYDYWFTQFDFPDENGNPYRSSGGKMVWNNKLKREIPEGWQVERLNDLVSVEKGISYKSDDILGAGIPMINLASFNTDGSYKPSGLKSFSGTVNTKKLVKPFDLIMCVTQQTAIDLTGKTNVIGKAVLVPNVFDKDDVAISTDVAKIVCNDSEDVKFLLFGMFKRPEIHKYIVGYGNGTKIKHLDVTGAFDLTIAIPPFEGAVLSDFAQIIRFIEREKSTLLNQIDQLERLKSWLLPMLMNGQVTVDE